VIVPVLLVAGGLAAIAYFVTREDEPPVHEPDLPPSAAPPPGMPHSTRYRLVDAILPDLAKASASSGFPLGLLVGWIARESGGRLNEITKLDERGYFQLMPAESKSLGLDHQRLSVDSIYSINGGLLLIGKYKALAEALGVATPGTPYFWKLVKLEHTMGSGATKKVVDAAKAEGDAGTWEALRDYALAHNDAILHETKHSPKKWFPLVDAVAEVGAPFGFGNSATTVVGGGFAYSDIPDELDVATKT
jgi:hypothetical protein